MKKIITLAVALATLAVPAATAQKINDAAFKAKLEKSNLDIENPKKSGKSATWYNRGKICVDAIVAPTKNIFSGLDANMLAMSLGVPATEVKGDIHSFDWVDIHTKNGKVVAWGIKKEVLPNAYEIAKEAFLKAYELDPASAAKIKTALDVLINHYSELGSVSLDVSEYKTAIDAYMKAVGLQQNPAIGKEDSRYYFFAGQLAAFLGAQDAKYFADGEKYLNKALELGYKDEQGNLYYFLFHCYYGQKSVDRDANLAKAKEALLTGIKKFPKNSLILDGLMNLYTAEEGVGDPAELVAMIDSSLKDDATNYDLWFGRGRVFYALKNFDEGVKSFEKCVELRPNDFEANFYTGYLIIEKANAAVEALNANSNLSYEEYEAEYAKINDIYAEAIPWLEKAHEINPSDRATIEFLNNLCFRLRDMDGMMDKYNKYHELFMN